MVGLGSLGFVVAIATYVTHAQTNQPIATCTNSTYLWTFNSIGQSPCLMTSWLGSVCSSGGTFNVPPLAPGNIYQGPSLGSDSPCICSSVLYSLISACALCQSADYLPWSTFSANCRTIYSEIFPFDIPANTKVPHWAYLNVTTNNQFLPAAAQLSTNAPESTHLSTSATSTSTRSASTSSASTTPSSAGSSSSSSNVGSIAGGVIGGLAGLALIAGLVFWWMRRRRSQPPPHVLLDPFPASMTEPLIGSTPMTFNQAPPFLDTPSMRFYDPSDPSTFPSSPVPSGYTAGGSLPHSSLDFSNPNPVSGAPYATNQGLRYTGAAEV